MPIVCFGCHGHAGTVQKDIDRLFGRIKKQQKSGREKELEAVERNFFDVMGFKHPKITLSTLYYPYIKYPLGGTQNPLDKADFSFIFIMLCILSIRKVKDEESYHPSECAQK